MLNFSILRRLFRKISTSDDLCNVFQLQPKMFFRMDSLTSGHWRWIGPQETCISLTQEER